MTGNEKSMKLAAIPVRGSKLILKNLHKIASQMDRVRIYATEVEFEQEELPANVEVDYSVAGLSDARHAGALWAREAGAEFVYEIDDDISGDYTEIIPAIEAGMLAYPFLASLCSRPKLLAYYSKERKSNLDFLLAPFPTQVWAIRLDAYFETPGFTAVSTMEDLYVGLYMWKMGWASATLTEHLHNPIRARLNLNRSPGGTPPLERDVLMPGAADRIRQDLVPSVMRGISLGKTKAGVYKLMPRYYWEGMIGRFHERFGYIDYRDNRFTA